MNAEAKVPDGTPQSSLERTSNTTILSARGIVSAQLQ